MKMRRSISSSLLLGMALLVVVTVLLWRYGGPVLPRESSALPAGTAPADEVPLLESISGLSPGAEPANASVLASTAASPAPPSLTDWLKALESIQTEADSGLQEEKLERLVNSIAPTELPMAARLLQELGSFGLRHQLGRRALRRWAENDPRAAAQWVTWTPLDSERQEVINDVAIVWANHSVSNAVAWVRQLPAESERNAGLMSVAYEAVRTEPMEVLRLGMELPAGEHRDDLITHAAGEWATIDPAAAAEWASQATDVALRDRLLASIATAWGDSDPVAAANLALKTLPPGRQQDDAVMSIVQRWAQQTPIEAAGWVSSFPEGTLRETAMEELVKLWTDQSLAEPANWLYKAALGSSRDAAVGAYVCKVTPHLPELAAQWTSEIKDESLRLREMEAVGEAWMESDSVAARAWIAQSDLPKPTRTRLLALSR
jgi:hypothetical protein